MDPDEPRQTARAAAERAGVTIHDGPDLDQPTRRALADLFRRVWGRDAAMGPIVSAEILWAAGHVGAPVAAAFAGERLVGGSVGFTGVRDGVTRVHSHLTGVLPDAAGAGVGRALKWHQRAWCLDRGIGVVEWTFDPLVRRNAVVNLVHLGARPVAWFDDLYGAMDDERNAGLPTDRLLVSWDLEDARVRQAAAGRTAEPRVDGLRRAGAEVALDEDDTGAPLVTTTTAPRRLARIPADVEALRARDKDLAADWALALREALGAPLQAGMRITGITRDGWYVLAQRGGVAEMA
jgi:predicted GNAT superfamily acetyltransferase